MSFDISLTSGMRADLTSLQGTAQLLNRTQQRLSSGKAVNSAVDDPAAYFAAQDHVNHASDLSSRKADMGEAIQAVNAANAGITNITTLINQAKGLLTSAQSANTTTRSSLADQFNSLRTQIDQLASDSGYNGKNFLQNDTLNVLFNETGSSTLTVQGFTGSSVGLTISQAALSTGTAYAAASVGNNLTNATYNLAHSGAINASSVVVTQTVTTLAAESKVATQASAGATNGISVTLSHAGSAGNVSVYETINAVSAGLIASVDAAAIAGGTNTADLAGTFSAMPTNLVVTGSQGALAEGAGGYTATFDTGTGKATIQILVATSNVSVSYTFSKNLTQGPSADYTISGGGLKSAASITFNKDFATASSISVKYDYKAAVDSTKYTLAKGSSAVAGSITVANSTTITGAVSVAYAANQLAWGSDAALQMDTGHLNAAISKLRTEASTMAANLSVITTRQTWSQSMINNLQTGSDNLTLADMNEEGANMLALQTRQQLGIQALSLASQSNQSIMRLFG